MESNGLAISDDGSKTWFTNSASDAFDTGIWSGVTTAQLTDPKYMQSIAGISKIYWNKYV